MLHNDMSGSIAKNRFRIEMLWGISKMFDIYDEYEDFTVVFDNVCDIEFHLDNGQEYYQIKSNKVASPKRINYYVKKPENGNSIFGKLIMLNDQKYNTLKIALVSNAYLCDGKKIFTEYEELSIDSLDKKYRDKIVNKLNEEFGETISIDNFYYIHTNMDLENPNEVLLGKTIYTFQKIKKCEPKKPNSLYRFIVDEVQRKAEYEFNAKDYEELILKKGFSKSQLESMLSDYCDNVDTSIEQVQKEIDKISSVITAKKLNLALINVMRYIDSSKELQKIENDIVEYLDETSALPEEFDDLTAHLVSVFSEQFSTEITEYEIRVFIMLIIKRWVSNYYE